MGGNSAEGAFARSLTYINPRDGGAIDDGGINDDKSKVSIPAMGAIVKGV